MNTREVQVRLKGGSRPEREAKLANFGVTAAKGVLGGSWFLALSKVSSSLYNFFYTNGKYFFLLGILLSYIGWIISAIELYHSANKNRGKVGNFIYATFSLALALVVGIVYVATGPFFGGILLVGSMFLDPVINIGCAIYYGIRAAFEKDPATNHFLRSRALSHGLIGGFAAVISGIFVALMMLTLLTWPVALTLAAVGLVASIVVAAFVPKIVAKMFGPTPPVPSSIILDENNEEPKSYYRNSVTNTSLNMAQLETKIDKQIAKVNSDIAKDKDSIIEKWFWSQEPKRQNKVKALKFLKRMKAEILRNAEQGQFIPESATEEQPYRLLGYPFHYTDKADLCIQISEQIPHIFPGAFQSHGAEIGDTQDCFNDLFLCIINGRSLLPKNNDEESSLRMV